jgi:hypothetical protein
VGATGTATIDFGAYPGKVDTSVTVTGQTGILAGSRVEAWIDTGTATAEHSTDEHIMANALMDITYGAIIVGTGFTIYALTRELPGIGSVDTRFNNLTVTTPRLYGTFTIAWAWV